MKSIDTNSDKVKSMEDFEIVKFAENIIRTITKDLNESLYSEPNACLKAVWKRDDSFNASATPKSKVTEPPVHTITINYGLALQLYQDIDHYCIYIESGFDQEAFDIYFKDYSNKFILPTNLTPENYRKNMFIGALTWVYFHELAHLNQEHVYVLNQLLSTKKYSTYKEFDINNSKALKGKAASIHHVLELAADSEAIQTCISELLRHFVGDELKESIGTFVIGISCAIYKIHDLDMLDLNSEIIGSHPPPMVRLEQILPQIYETFDSLEQSKLISINTNRVELIHQIEKSSLTSGFFWFRKKLVHPDKMAHFFHSETTNRIGGKKYLRTIIDTWDEIEPVISKYRRNNRDLSILTFSEDYRRLVFNNSE